MIEDACHNLVGQMESAAASGTIYNGPCARADRFGESEKFRAKGLGSGRREFFELYFRVLIIGKKSAWSLRALLDTHAQDVLSPEVDRYVFLFLKEAHLADALRGDAAGREVCN